MRIYMTGIAYREGAECSSELVETVNEMGDQNASKYCLCPFKLLSIKQFLQPTQPIDSEDNDNRPRSVSSS